MSFHCGKPALTLTWGILECVFFSGILNGWIWLKQILNNDFYFMENCNFTSPPTSLGTTTDYNATFITYDHGQRWICRYEKIRIVVHRGSLLKPTPPFITTPYSVPTINTTLQTDLYQSTTGDYLSACKDQQQRVDLIISLIFIIRNILMLPFGIFLDKYGTSKTRIFAISFLACGSLMMLFSSNNFPWLGLPALILLSISGFLILLTDLQIANLFGARRYTVMSVLVGAYHSGGFMLFLMKITRDEGMSLQTSFMLMAVGMVPVLISTIALLPRSRIPWPLPLNYGKNGYSSSIKEEKYSSSDWQRRISIGEKNCKEAPNIIFPVLRSSLYLWLLIWFTILSLKAFIFDTNIDLTLANLTENTGEALHFMNIYGMLMLFSLPASPIIGIVMDWQKSFVTDPKTDQMMNILNAVVVTYVISFLSGVTAMLPYTGFHVITCILVTIEKVAALSTLCAFITHVHFPSECFGRCFGLVICVSGVVMIFQFAIKMVISSTFQNQMLYVNLIMLLLLPFAAGHPISVWYHCKRGWIQDTSLIDPRKSVTIKLMNSNNDPDEADAVIEHVQCDISKQKTYLQVTDL